VNLVRFQQLAVYQRRSLVAIRYGAIINKMSPFKFMLPYLFVKHLPKHSFLEKACEDLFKQRDASLSLLQRISKMIEMFKMNYYANKYKERQMKRRFYIQIQILLILVLSTMFNNVIYCQNSKQDTIPAKIIELAQGCKLVLDTKIDVTDSLSIEIITGVREIMPRIQTLISADSITINLAISSSEVLPMLGVGSRTTSDHSLLFYFDPKNPNFRVEFIARGLAHECLHVSRSRMPHWQLTLLECMITEGLADHFMVEVLNCEQPAWSRALTEKEIKQYMIKVKPILRIRHEWTQEFNEKYFFPWMFGGNGIPHWTGYSLGWRIVENYLKAHPEARASSLVFAPAEVIASSTPELTVSK
jgi:hypothetical protein